MVVLKSLINVHCQPVCAILLNYYSVNQFSSINEVSVVVIVVDVVEEAYCYNVVMMCYFALTQNKLVMHLTILSNTPVIYESLLFYPF